MNLWNLNCTIIFSNNLNLKSKTSISNAAIIILVFTIVGRLLGLVREVIYAHNFGLSSSYDIYLISSIIPLTITSIFFYIIQNYFIPQYNRVKARDKKLVNNFISNVIFLFLFFIIVITIPLLFLKNQILSLYLGFGLVNFDLISKVYLIFLLTIPISIIFAIFSAYLQAEFEFKSPALAQVFQNLFIILIVGFFSSQFGILSIVVGYFLGTILQLIYLYLIVKKKTDFKMKLLNYDSRLFHTLSISLFYIIIIESISQLYLLSDRYFFRNVETGGIAALNYATNLYSLPISIIAVTIATAIFPSLSELFESKNFNEIFKKVERFIIVNIFLFMPIVFIFYFWGMTIISILFERGHFLSSDTLLTFSTLKFYAFGLIPFSIYAGLNKLFYAYGWIKKLLWLTIAAITIKITLNYYLVGEMQQNGLALSTSVSYSALFLFSTYFLWIEEKKINFLKIIYSFFNYFICAFTSYIIVILFINTLIPVNNLFLNVFEIVFFLFLYLITQSIINDLEFLQNLDYFLSILKKYKLTQKSLTSEET